jgi:hypothetical protein
MAGALRRLAARQKLRQTGRLQIVGAGVQVAPSWSTRRQVGALQGVSFIMRYFAALILWNLLHLSYRSLHDSAARRWMHSPYSGLGLSSAGLSNIEQIAVRIPHKIPSILTVKRLTMPV